MKKYLLNSEANVSWSHTELTGIFSLMFIISTFLWFVDFMFDVVIFFLSL